MIQHAQNKALRIINFKQFMKPSESLFNQLNKINNLKNKIMLHNIMFAFNNLVNSLSNVSDFSGQFFKTFN